MKTAYDPTYHQRVRGRNLQKTAAIINYLATVKPPIKTALDVGCNQGYMSRALLDAGAESVGAVELNADVVDGGLRIDPRFDLHAGDLLRWKPCATYNIVLYCSVHHHIVQAHGIEKAKEIFRKLVNTCERVLFFETGLMIEQGGHPWQRTLRSLYKTDDLHITDILRECGDRFDRVTRIAAFPIQGADRPVFAVHLRPPKEADTDA